MNLEECLEHFRKRTSELKQNKAEQIKLLKDEIEDWRLEERVE